MDAKTDDRRVRKTKKALRNGLASLMMEKKLKDITVRELADRVDLNRGTFYTHYRDINDLYEKIEEEIFDEVNGILDEFAPVQISGPPFAILLELVKYMVENAEMCRMMFGEKEIVVHPSAWRCHPQKVRSRLDGASRGRRRGKV
jgi:AcrR family transcriptional regulator